MVFDIRTVILLVATWHVVLALLHPFIEREQYNTGNEVSDVSIGRRRPRAAQIIGSAVMIGMKAFKSLIKGAKEIYSGRSGRMFVKSGGYRQAVTDFYSVSPTEVLDLTVRKSGMVGDRRIEVKVSVVLGRPVVSLKKRTKNNKNITDIILYDN